MTSAIQTVKAIDAKVVAAAESDFRRHLGASVIGTACARKVWYSFHWTLEAKHAGQTLRLFERGKREEPIFVGYLRSIGVDIWEYQLELKDGKPVQWRIADHWNHFGGSLDAVGCGLPDLAPGEPFVCEFKTHGDKSFQKLKSEGLLKSKWEHFVQMQVYMGKMELRYALYCAVNKNDDELYFEIVHFDEKIYLDALARAKNIIETLSPPPRISESPGHFGCKWCHLNRLCHFGDVTPARNCRTCAYSEPAFDHSGEWFCKLKSNNLTEDMQRAACPEYKVNPVLIKTK